MGVGLDWWWTGMWTLSSVYTFIVRLMYNQRSRSLSLTPEGGKPMVYAGIADITPIPFKHFQGCHESTQVYSGRMEVAPAGLGLELHSCIGDLDQRLFRFQRF